MYDLLLEPGDISVKVDAILPGSVGVLPDPLGKLTHIRPLFGLQICLQQQLSMKSPLKILHTTWLVCTPVAQSFTAQS